MLLIILDLIESCFSSIKILQSSPLTIWPSIDLTLSPSVVQSVNPSSNRWNSPTILNVLDYSDWTREEHTDRSAPVLIYQKVNLLLLQWIQVLIYLRVQLLVSYYIYIYINNWAIKHISTRIDWRNKGLALLVLLMENF